MLVLLNMQTHAVVYKTRGRLFSDDSYVKSYTNLNDLCTAYNRKEMLYIVFLL